MTSIEKAIEIHPRINDQLMTYGTSGIRAKANTLDCTLFRMGMVAVVRSKMCDAKAIGLMITASHNPVDDNGFKLIDFDGGMLDSDWESICTSIANQSDEDLELAIINLERKFANHSNNRALVYVARDTRPSSKSLSDAAIDGIKALAGNYQDFGLLTTPQLHFIVREYNLGNKDGASEEGYYKKFSEAFIDFCNSLNGQTFQRYENQLHLDCANGVGGPIMAKFVERISSLITIHLNNSGDGIVNHDCGSTHVEKTHQEAINCSVNSGEKWASFDGDADRIVYYYRKSSSDQLTILDGDKLAALFCLYVKELLKLSSLDSQLTLQVIQTAYSNKMSENFIAGQLGVRVTTTATGVKNLMRKASNCDISIFFEANGHGSIIYNNKAKMTVEDTANRGNKSAQRLTKLLSIANLATGDAISDLLITEAILKAKDWTISDWDKVYVPLASRLLQVKVPDRNFIKTNEIATEILEPEGLQREIFECAGKDSHVKCIVRPSGTEDIVRVYVEASTQEDANKIAFDVVKLVEDWSQKCLSQR